LKPVKQHPKPAKGHPKTINCLFIPQRVFEIRPSVTQNFRKLATPNDGRSPGNANLPIDKETTFKTFKNLPI
ncbi:MAG: hypothetical protein K2I11_00995, partial [Bacteroides sp.]|nr:hypothetical protein [Bacteroides sp.]